jgi:peptide/nickel transport system permease protein
MATGAAPVDELARLVAPRRLRAREGSGTGLVVAGGCILALVIAGWLAAPLLSSWGSMQIDPNATLSGPGGAHLLGTDINGMDVWSRTLHAVPVDLGIAVLSVAIAAAVGSAIGVAIGFLGGWIDDALMRVADILQAFPTFILALAVAALIGRSPFDLICVLAVVYAPSYARLARAEARTVRELPYVDAARLTGTGVGAILRRHVLPNCLAPVRVLAPLNCGWAMLALAGLSFVGLGIAPPHAEWGAMISLGSSDVVSGRWWTSVPPGVALLLCVLAFSMVGEGLQDRSVRRSS